jgi:hypothetical protein
MVDVCRFKRLQDLCLAQIVGSFRCLWELERCSIDSLTRRIPLGRVSSTFRAGDTKTYGQACQRRRRQDDERRSGDLHNIFREYPASTHRQLTVKMTFHSDYRGNSPLGSAAAMAANSSSPPSTSLCALFFFFGLSPLNLSFLDTALDIVCV